MFGYVEGGGYTEETLRRNRADIQALRLLPKSLNDVSVTSLATTILGQEAAMPLVLAPIGAAGFTWPNGEVEAAKAAKAAGIPFCLSTLSISTIEDVAEATRAPFWFQLYLTRDRGIANGLIERARNADCSTLVLTVDAHCRSQRHREQKGGFNAPLHPTFPMAMQTAARLGWLLRMLRSRRRTFANLVGLLPCANSVAETSMWLGTAFDRTIGPKEIEWLRKIWPRKLVVKGIMHPDDAKLAISAGADAIVVSNHGGRQVDGATSSAAILGPIVDAVNGTGEVLVDGGVRSGIDVLKLLALGADSCMVGRAFVYGLAAGGEAGVARAIEILREELRETMALCGVSDVNQVSRTLLHSRQTYCVNDW